MHMEQMAVVLFYFYFLDAYSTIDTTFDLIRSSNTSIWSCLHSPGVWDFPRILPFAYITYVEAQHRQRLSLQKGRHQVLTIM